MPRDIDALAELAQRFAVAVIGLAEAMDVPPPATIAGLRVALEAAEETAAEMRAAHVN